jgi:hypothetical protein
MRLDFCMIHTPGAPRTNARDGTNCAPKIANTAVQLGNAFESASPRLRHNDLPMLQTTESVVSYCSELIGLRRHKSTCPNRSEARYAPLLISAKPRAIARR